jgi:L-alanine-DL-glutamate epimerase-like enolase superfamily enzyme
MIITDIRYHPYRVPFKQPFTTAHGTLTAREGVIVEVVTDAGVSGYGDMAAVTEFGAPDVPTLIRALDAVRSQKIIGFDIIRLGDFRREMIIVEMHFHSRATLPRPLLFALDCCFSDALARRPGPSLYNNDGLNPGVPINATIGAADRDVAVADATAAVVQGIRCIKLKVGTFADARTEVSRIMAVREAIGPDVRLRIDANEAWTFEQARTILSQLAEADIQFVEQPLPRAQWENLPLLRRHIPMPLAADEALTDYASVEQLVAAKATEFYILKPQLLGGFFITSSADALAGQSGGMSVITTSLESGIGVAATIQIAHTRLPHLAECGLATLPLLEDDLIEEEIIIRDGMIQVPLCPVTPDWDALARYRLEVADL